ncbi:hypothetical protein ACQKCU_23735 [Heyndrickxia sporothermodurans]
MKKYLLKIVVILLALFIVVFLILGTIYPYSFAGISKNIDYNSKNKVLSEYKSNVAYLKKHLDSQDINSSTKDTIRKTLTLFSDPIFMKKGNNKVSKTDLEEFNNDMLLLATEIHKSIKENGKTFSTDELTCFVTLKSHFEVNHEWLNNYLDESFVNEKKWNELLNEFHKNLLVDLKELKVFYKSR